MYIISSRIIQKLYKSVQNCLRSAVPHTEHPDLCCPDLYIPHVRLHCCVQSIMCILLATRYTAIKIRITAWSPQEVKKEPSVSDDSQKSYGYAPAISLYFTVRTDKNIPSDLYPRHVPPRGPHELPRQPVTVLCAYLPQQIRSLHLLHMFQAL